MRSKKDLAVFLSKLRSFEKPSWKLEQYPTDSDIAAEIVWEAHIKNDLHGKEVVDLGCGTGILGLGALLAGASKVYFVDIDNKALSLAKKNLEFVKEYYELEGDSSFVLSDVNNLEAFEADVVLMNPPFGVKLEHADKEFLEKAYEIAPIIYSFHKTETSSFVKKITDEYGFGISNTYNFDFPLKKTMDYHKKKVEKIKVTCFRLQKKVNYFFSM
ncbi:methyltransferase [Candidatus Woesearchaeota archaeon]|nr:methyltransferase [Candidatus Woesearchaeota archaeon]